MVIQKDWIVYNLEYGDLFYLSIVKYPDTRGKGSKKRKKQWFIKHYENYFNLNLQQMQNKLQNDYFTIFQNAKNIKEYDFSLGKHTFSPGDINKGYWSGILKKKPSNIFNRSYSNIHLPINLKNLNRELTRLIPEKISD